MLNIYLAIGHFKGNKDITCVAMATTNMKNFRNNLKGNEFVAYVTISEKMFASLKSMDNYEIYEQVKKMTTNYRVWTDVEEYIEECMDIMQERFDAEKAYIEEEMKAEAEAEMVGEIEEEIEMTEIIETEAVEEAKEETSEEYWDRMVEESMKVFGDDIPEEPTGEAVGTFKKTRVALKVYDGVKYEAESKKIAENIYEILNFEVVEGEAAKIIEAETSNDCIDEYHEYLVMHFVDGEIATFRNSHVDLFVW